MPDEPDGYGFDKAARLFNERSAAAQEDGEVRLNEPFPYRSIPFKPEIFGARPSYVIAADQTEDTNNG